MAANTNPIFGRTPDVQVGGVIDHPPQADVQGPIRPVSDWQTPPQKTRNHRVQGTLAAPVACLTTLTDAPAWRCADCRATVQTGAGLTAQSPAVQSRAGSSSL